MKVEVCKMVELISELHADPTSYSESVQPDDFFSDPSIHELILLDAGEPVLLDAEELVHLDVLLDADLIFGLAHRKNSESR